MNYQDYIWDLGGTLLDNYETSTLAFVETLRIFGYQAEHDAVYKALKVSTDYAVNRFAPTEKDFLKCYKENEAKRLASPVLFEGTREILQGILSHGGRNFLISHRDNQVLDILEKAGIDSCFSDVITSANHFKRKPNPESILYLKKKYAIHSGLVIGDRPIDIEAGQAAGLDTYLFDSMNNLKDFINLT
ncbi:MAG: HAD-IA family hydrolase [Streptococcus sp.]|nr:HAD-IA family hydrolase [Streptococcus sp.]